MIYDLRRTPWLRFRRRSGTLEWATIASIVRGIDGDDPIVAIATPRADFDATATEFLIGLLTAALSPQDEAEWLERWKSPPTETELQDALDALPDAFALDGDGPRFMQDFSAGDLASQPVEPVQELLLNAKNSGLFIKPESVMAMSRAAAAMALITMQTYSTAGGRGFRTSIRGGGPLTTLVDPREQGAPEVPLWHLLWANVETAVQLENAHRRGGEQTPANVFPWLAPTRTSARNEPTTPDDAHALQAYFGMPRRIRLELSETTGVCDLTGLHDGRLVTGLRGKNHGVKYEGWLHPLSPYYEGNSPNEKLPVHPQPGGIGWRDWLPLLHEQLDTGTQPAATVTHFRSNRARMVGLRSYAVRAFGYDASKAKLRAWTSSSLPEFADVDRTTLATLTRTVRGLVGATEIAAFLLNSAVVNARHARGDEVKGDPTGVRSLLWHEMEPSAYEAIASLVAGATEDAEVRRLNERFRDTLARVATRLFDIHAPTDSTDPQVIRRVIRARWSLVSGMAGHGKMGDKLFTCLNLVSLGDRKKRQQRSSKTKRDNTGATS